jgi:pyruvate/2-oxoacid:ferredoxin oxidoreductase beta subunit
MLDYEVDLRAPELCGEGHLACQGCGATLAMRYALKALGPRTIIALPACCWSVIAGPFPYCNLGIPVYHCAFETGAATASGIRAGLDAQGVKDVTVMSWAGDGGTFDIGLQALSGAAERNDNILVACYDNEAYMNTGIQRSSATPYGAWTTTTPEAHPKEDRKKDIDRIVAAHGVPYLATTSVAFPEDVMRKFKRAKEIVGFRFIHVITPCPAGWRMPSDMTITTARMIVDSNLFPLYEVENGQKFTINYHPKRPIPVAEYLKTQGRFRHFKQEQIDALQAEADARWSRLLDDAGESGS